MPRLLPVREATAHPSPPYALSQQMPDRPRGSVGGLPNGLRFLHPPNGRPARQAELRLVVKAGSVLER
jgi:predicted Zn-dependent peptidase